MNYSRECEYAIRAAIYLAEHPNHIHYPLEISTQEKVPQHLVLRAMGTLHLNGIVEQTDDMTPGFKLAKDAGEITLYDIKAAIDGTDDLEACAIGLGKCSDSVPCALHESYKPLRKAWIDYLEKTNLNDLAEALQDKRKQLGA